MSSEAKKSRKKSVEKKVEEAARDVESKVEKAGKTIKKDAGKTRAKTPKAAHPKPVGKAPVAMVSTRHGTGMITRPGRGFSLSELSKAGITARNASEWGAKVDQKRRSAVEGNVGALKAWSAHVGTGAAARKEAKEIEAQVEDVAHELKVDAEEIEQEAVKVAKAAKKEAKKAEGAVKSKADKPRKKKESG
ncbi:MAG: ribosomal protein L13e [Nitrososphaerota archaeon]|nr:ribosomal protein L13e [Nitrososphaerota archaeon]